MHDTGFYLTPQQAERLADLCAVKGGQLVEAAHARIPVRRIRPPSRSFAAQPVDCIPPLRTLRNSIKHSLTADN